MQNSYNLGFPGPFLPSHLGTLYKSIKAQSAAPSWSSPFTRNIPSPCRARRVMDGDTGPLWRQQDTLQAGICSELCLARYLQFSGTLKKTLVLTPLLTLVVSLQALIKLCHPSMGSAWEELPSILAGVLGSSAFCCPSSAPP